MLTWPQIASTHVRSDSMINAAVVGLGTWGKTMVELLAGGSDLMRFTALQTRTVTPDVEAFAKQHSLRIAESYEEVLADPKIDAVALATPASGHLQADRGRRGRRQARLLREAVHLLQEGGRGGGRRRAQGQAHGRRRLQPALPSGDDQAARPDQGGRTRHDPAHRSQHDLPERAVPAADRVALQQGRGAARRPRADGRARHRR